MEPYPTSCFCFPPLTLILCDSGRDNQLRVKSPQDPKLAGWFRMENANHPNLKMDDDWGTTILGNLYMRSSTGNHHVGNLLAKSLSLTIKISGTRAVHRVQRIGPDMSFNRPPLWSIKRQSFSRTERLLYLKH